MLLKISTDAYIPVEKILIISDYKSNQTKRMVSEAKKNGKIFNTCHAKKIKSEIILTDGMVVLSPYEAKTLTSKIN